MKQQDLVELYPATGETVALSNLYRDAELVPAGHSGIFVYSNFVISLDGRIALADRRDGHLEVPAQIANARDWRLFQELAARSDCVLTSGRNLRDLAQGRAQDVLPLGPQSEFDDLRDWRLVRGEPAQPDVAVLSASLDFPPPVDLVEAGRQVSILTSEDAPAERAELHRGAGARVVRVPGQQGVQGRALVDALAQLGYRRVYSMSGPQVLATLVAADALDCLFLTTVPRLLGGMPATTLMEGPALPVAADLRMRWMYYDRSSPDTCGQTFARYDRA